MLLSARWFFWFIVLIGLLTGPWLPWYSIAIIAVVAGLLFRLSAVSAAGRALLAGLLVWGGGAAWAYVRNDGLLADRMGQLFGGLDGWMMVAVTALVGALLAALGSTTGVWLREALRLQS